MHPIYYSNISKDYYYCFTKDSAKPAVDDESKHKNI